MKRTKVALITVCLLSSAAILAGCGRPTPPNGMTPPNGQAPSQFSGERPTPPSWAVSWQIPDATDTATQDTTNQDTTPQQDTNTQPNI